MTKFGTQRHKATQGRAVARGQDTPPPRSAPNYTGYFIPCAAEDGTQGLEGARQSTLTTALHGFAHALTWSSYMEFIMLQYTCLVYQM